jgi:hypothetical protein
LKGAAEVENGQRRAFIANVRLAVWGEADDVRRAIERPGGAGPGEDNLAEALAAFGLREVG